MIRYFQSNVEDAIRIVVITGDTDDDIYEANEAHRTEEVTADKLPPDFSNWKQYTAHAYTNSTVRILSRNGD